MRSRKRQRLSSPTYDEQVDLSQDDIDAFDKIQQRISQSQSSPTARPTRKARAMVESLEDKENGGHRSASPSKARLAFSSQSPLETDAENPFKVSTNNTITGAYPPFQNASAYLEGSSIPTFVSATALSVTPSTSQPPPQSQSRSPSPEVPPERDYSEWFQPLPIPIPQTALFTSSAALFAPASALRETAAPALFATASALLASTASTTEQGASLSIGANQLPLLGFMKASHKSVIAPSAAALEEAQQKMRVWHEKDLDPELDSHLDVNLDVAADSSSSSFPDTPTPAGPGAGSGTHRGFERPSATATNGSLPTFSASPGFISKPKPKPFRPPTQLRGKNTNMAGFTSSPLNPSRMLGFAPASAGAQPLAQQQQHYPLAGTPFTSAAMTPIRPVGGSVAAPAGLVTPMRPLLGSGSVIRSTPARFVTPFKAGMRPGEAGWVGNASQANGKGKEKEVVRVDSGDYDSVRNTPKNGKKRWKAFDLRIPPNRQTLASCGLVPQSYSFEHLETMGINTTEISQITPTTALYYSFHTPTPILTSASQLPPITTLLGTAAALEQLLAKGCTMATKPWVDNHWAMVLWKLAGMVCLDPEKESDGREKRWCWGEVMRQLLYRYERELNSGFRPPLRKICVQDAPASSPMVLCISNITWSGHGGITDDGTPMQPFPELELTDGWYRMRAQVDESLARAVRKNILKVGRKIGIAGARLSSERKDPMEILEAFNSTRLVISGNSSHLASWHAKLGFQTGPYISTLHHLNGDGGSVAVMAITVVKVYPVAFIEFIDENGSKQREGPRNQNEEFQVNEKWKARREVEESKLWVEHDKRTKTLERYVDRLERRAGPRFCPTEDASAPDHIDNFYDELEDPVQAAKVITGVTPNEAGWLARFIREKSLRDREVAGEEIERELQKIIPPREVRNFRILVVQDAYSNRRPAHRRAQLTVWDALNLSHSEESQAGSFELGQRFMVTNLMPTQASAWMGRDEADSEVYLSTRRDSRWTRLK